MKCYEDFKNVIIYTNSNMYYKRKTNQVVNKNDESVTVS